MKIFKKIGSFAALIFLAFSFSACGNPIIKVNTAATYPKPEEVVTNLEDSGFDVQRFEKFEELEIETIRIKASKGKEYLDICYNVLSDEDLETISEYYKNNYKRYKLVRNADIVFCYSSKSVKESAGLW